MNQTPKKKDAKAIFSAAIEYYMPDQWEGYIVTACGEDEGLRQRVRALLDAHRQGDSFLDDREHPATQTSPVSERPGSEIGPYKLLQQIGEGGFGVVYMAEQQQPVRRKVALKIIKPGMDTKQVIAWFEAERQALAMMDHPNIAKVLDAGSTESGRPYFVMELVKGVPVTEFCDSNKLSTQERLELFITVCRAVQHAHQKGVIHRDLKPSNVMVTLHDNKPMPVIIDFGVSKAISHQLTEKTLFTAYGQMVGTPAYMSPEQAQMSRMDIDTRSGVYSLGVLLYELLTGSTPIDAEQLRGTAYVEMQRLIREEEAPRPSTRVSTQGKALAKIAQDRSTDPKRLGQFLRGDLDWIVMKALEKERSRRYDTANGLANDIQRFLKDEAVEACPPSLAYQVRKFVGRNRGLVTTASLVMAAVLLGIVGTTVGMLRARQDAEVARVALANADEAHDLAKTMAEEKRLEAEAALKAKQEAEGLRDQAKAQAAKQLVMRASAERDRGDITLAALLGAEALQQDSGDSERELIYRQRLAADLRQCPRPTHLFFHDSTVLDARFSGDGKWIATSCGDGVVRIYDAGSGTVQREMQHDGAVDQVGFRANDTRLLALEVADDSSDEGLSHKLILWDRRSGKRIAESPTRPFQIGTPSFGHTIYPVITGKHGREARSAVDGQLVGPAFETDWVIRGSHTFRSDAVLLFLQKPIDEPHETNSRIQRSGAGGRGSRGPAPQQMVQQVQIWNPISGRRLTLVEQETSRERFGRGRSVSGVFSPDEKLIALNVKGNLQIHSVDSGELISRVDSLLDPSYSRSSSGGVISNSMAFSPDSRTLVIKLRNGVMLVDVASGTIQQQIDMAVDRRLQFLSSGSQDVKFSADSATLLMLNMQGHPQLWSLETGQTSSPPMAHDSTVRDFGFSPDGGYIKVVGIDGNVRIWNAQTGQPATPMMRHSGNINASLFNRDGSHLMVAIGSKVYLWPIGLPQFAEISIPVPMIGNGNPFQSLTNNVQISRDGERVVTAWNSTLDRNAPRDVRIWNAENGQLLHQTLDLIGSTGFASSIPFRMSDDGKLIMLDAVPPPFGGPSSANQENQESLPGIQIWNTETGEVVETQENIVGRSVASGFSSNGKVVWGTTISGSRRTPTVSSRPMITRIWDSRTGKPLGPPIEHSVLRRSFSSSHRERTISHDAARIVGVERVNDSTLLRIRDTGTGEPIGDAMHHEADEGEIVHCFFSDDDQQVVSAARVGDQLSIRLWDIRGKNKRAHQPSIVIPQAQMASHIELDPKSKRIAVYAGVNPLQTRFGASSETEISKAVAVCDFSDRAVKRLHHEQAVINACFSPDGSHVLTNCRDRVIRIWDSTNGELVRSLESPDQYQEFSDSHFSKDGRRVVAAQPTGEVQIWDLLTGQPLTLNQRNRLDPMVARLTATIRSRTGGTQSIVSAMANRYVVQSDDEVVIYDLSADQRPAERLVQLTRVLSGRGINQLGNVETLPPQQWRKEWNDTQEDLKERLLPSPQGESWHMLQVARSTNDHTTLWHLDRLLRTKHDRADFYQRRADILAEHGRHADAVADFDKAESLGATVFRNRAPSLASLQRWKEAAADYEQMELSLESRTNRAPGSRSGSGGRGFEANSIERQSLPLTAGIAYLSAGDREGYERACESEINATSGRVIPPIRLTMSTVCLLVPRDAEYCKKLHNQFETGAAEIPSQFEGVFAQMSSMSVSVSFDELIRYRHGDYEEVLGIASDDSGMDAQRTPGSLLIRAMAHKQLGNDDEARRLYEMATSRITDVDQRQSNSPETSERTLSFPTRTPRVLVPDWVPVQIIELLRHEAEELIIEVDK